MEPPLLGERRSGVANWRDKALRGALTAAHRLLRLARSLRRKRRFGVHALALTPERRIILVKLRYAPGWRLPGGGRAEDEDARDAILRELREEIGMTSCGRIRTGLSLPAGESGIASVLIVEDVAYRPPPWSWEVEQVMEAPADDLPRDLAPVAAKWIAALRRTL